ncbi:reverse transcriptase domain-containing protein [Tanacetum coccineum]
MGERVGRGGGRVRGPREGNDERVNELNGQGNDQGLGAKGGVEGVNGNVEEVNGGVGGAPDFSTIIAQQLQNLLPTMLAQVGNQGNVGNQNGNVVNENVQENVGNVLVNGNRIEKIESVQDMSGCSINQKVKYIAGSFVGKALTWWNSQIRTIRREVVVSMSWNDFKFMMIEEFCPSHEMQELETELWNHVMVRAGHVTYTDRFHELARLVPHLVTIESRMIERYVYGLALQIRMMVAAIEPKAIQKAIQISGALTDEVVRNGLIKKVEKRGNMREPSKDKNGRDDNKSTRTGNAFATTANPVGRENTGPKENRPNQVVANNGGQGRGNQGSQARGRAFMLGAEEARQDPNIMTGTFTLNNHFATTIFDSGADYSFVSTTFIPLSDIEPNELGFRYEIEIASGQLVEIDKVIEGCKLEIKGHVFDIDLIPFGHRSFDVIIALPQPPSPINKPGDGAVTKNSGNVIAPSRPIRHDVTFFLLILPSADKSAANSRQKSGGGGFDSPVLQTENAQCGMRLHTNQLRFRYSIPYLRIVVWKVGDGGMIEEEVEMLVPTSLVIGVRNGIGIQTLKDKMCNDLVLALLAWTGRHLWYIVVQSQDRSRLCINAKNKVLGVNARSIRNSLDMSMAYHPQNDGQSERTIQNLEDMLRACVLDFGGSWDVHIPLVEFSYNNSYHSSRRQLIGPELMQEITKNVSQIKDRLKEEVKLAPKFVGPFEIVEKVGHVAYRLDLPKELNSVHDTFHVSNLKKCLANPTLQVPLDEIQVDAKLNFVEERVEI